MLVNIKFPITSQYVKVSILNGLILLSLSMATEVIKGRTMWHFDQKSIIYDLSRLNISYYGINDFISPRGGNLLYTGKFLIPAEKI